MAKKKAQIEAELARNLVKYPTREEERSDQDIAAGVRKYSCIVTVREGGSGARTTTIGYMTINEGEQDESAWYLREEGNDAESLDAIRDDLDAMPYLNVTVIQVNREQGYMRANAVTNKSVDGQNLPTGQGREVLLHIYRAQGETKYLELIG